MSRIFITGSADGLGFLAAKQLLSEGHEVVLHARNESRCEETRKHLPQVSHIVSGDLSNIRETIELAHQLNSLGTFDAVVHNAGVYQASPQDILHVNVLAPYILTSLMNKPKRLVYLSSGMHFQGRVNFDSMRQKPARITYSDSKLYVLMLSIIAAQRWPDVYSNAVDPGWVPTKMGGAGAPDDLQKGYETQVWLTTSNEAGALVSGKYFFHKTTRQPNTSAEKIEYREKLFEVCSSLTGISFPLESTKS